MSKKQAPVPIQIEEMVFDEYTEMRGSKTSLGIRLITMATSFNAKVNDRNMRGLLRMYGLSFKLDNNRLTVTIIPTL